jgi:DNA-binding HxlR family transcriptional regulator
MKQTELYMLLLFFKALADENRLKIVGLLLEKERNVGELAEILGLKEPTVSHHLSKLRKAGLINLRADGNQRFYSVNTRNLKRMSDLTFDLDNIEFQIDKRQPDQSWIEELDLDDYDRKVLRDYTENRRLTQIPVKQKKLLAVLRWLIAEFQPDVTYTEKQVSTILEQYHEDYAGLRRAMIEYGFMRRERGGGKYWVTPENEVR